VPAFVAVTANIVSELFVSPGMASPSFFQTNVNGPVPETMVLKLAVVPGQLVKLINALALTEACVARGVPIFGICRGLQEMNVAFGGSLHPEIREIPGRMNHRMPRLENGEIHPDPTVVFADRHDVHLTPGGAFASLLGCETIRVNSLHGQGILEPGARVVIEGIAEDGTIEAIRIADAASFALGVQWHAEYDPQRNPINRKLFEAFGEALKTHQRTG